MDRTGVGPRCVRAGSYEATQDRELVRTRGRQITIKTASRRLRQLDIGSDPNPGLSGEVFEQFPCDVAFEASN